MAPVWFLRCDIATRVGVKQNRAQIATGQAFRPLRPVDGFEYEKLRGKHGVRIQQFHDSGMCANDDLNFCFEIDVASRQSGPFRIAQTIEFVDVPKKSLVRRLVEIELFHDGEAAVFDQAKRLVLRNRRLIPAFDPEFRQDGSEQVFQPVVAVEKMPVVVVQIKYPAGRQAGARVPHELVPAIDVLQHRHARHDIGGSRFQIIGGATMEFPHRERFPCLCHKSGSRFDPHQVDLVRPWFPPGPLSAITAAEVHDGRLALAEATGNPVANEKFRAVAEIHPRCVRFEAHLMLFFCSCRCTSRRPAVSSPSVAFVMGYLHKLRPRSGQPGIHVQPTTRIIRIGCRVLVRGRRLRRCDLF